MFSLDQQDVNSSCNLKSLHMHSLEGALKSILKWKNVLSSGGKILMFCFNGFFWGKKKNQPWVLSTGILLTLCCYTVSRFKSWGNIFTQLKL